MTGSCSSWIARGVVLVVLAFSCSRGGGGGGGSDGGSVVPVVVGAQGGTAAFPDQGVELSIPAGAVSGETSFAAEVVPAANAPAVPSEFSNAGAVVRLTPEGTTFSEPVQVRLSIPNGPATSRWVMLRRASDGGDWEAVGAAEAGATQVEGWTSHFSYFVVAQFVPAASTCLVRGQDGAALTCGDSGCSGSLTVTQTSSNKGMRCVPDTSAPGEIVCSCEGGSTGSHRVTALRGTMALGWGMAVAVLVCELDTCPTGNPPGPDGGTSTPDGGSSSGPGSIDSSFGQSGLALTTIGGHMGQVNDVVVLESGEIAVVGVGGGGISGTDPAAVYALFSSAGTPLGNPLLTNIESSRDESANMVLPSSGSESYVVGATGFGSNTLTRFVAMRYTGGALDGTYGSPRFPIPQDPPLRFGYRTVGFSASSPKQSFATSAFLQSTGNLVVAGVTSSTADTTDQYNIGLARFTTTGELDGTTVGDEGNPDDAQADGFGAGKRGTVSTSLAAYSGDVRVIKDASGDGFSVVAGAATTRVAKYTADGALDTSFGTNGFSTVNLPGRRFSKRGSVLVSVGEGPAQALTVGKFTPELTAASAFGSGGVATFSSYSGDRPPAIADALGRIYVMAKKGSHFVLIRLLTNGGLDSAFGNAGEAALPFAATGTSTYCVAGGIALQPDGKIIAVATVGHSENGGSVNAELVRVLP